LEVEVIYSLDKDSEEGHFIQSVILKGTYEDILFCLNDDAIDQIDNTIKRNETKST